MLDSNIPLTILSIGHSTLAYEDFVARLKSADVTAVADVRTAPYSRRFPQFSRETLQPALAADGLAYVFLGRELGGRPSSENFTEGVADYEKMARTPSFREGLERLKQGARTYRVAMMCSERDPMECHRCLLVGRALRADGVRIEHILDEDRRLGQDEIEERLMAEKPNTDMFADAVQQLADAYRERSRKVAFAERQTDPVPLAS